jgi:hypothetical protein
MTGCLMSPPGSVASPLSRGMLILSGLTSSRSLQPLGMLFGKSGAVLKHGDRPLIGLGQTLGQFPCTPYVACQGGLRPHQITGPAHLDGRMTTH